MEKEIKEQAQKLFELGQKAKLLSSEDYSAVFPDAKLNQISAAINRDKATFIRANQDIVDPEKLWNDGVDLRIADNVAQAFVDFLVENSKAFSLSYDQPVEDIIFNFKSVSSDLSITDLGEKQEDGEWLQGMKVGNEIFWYPSESDNLVGDVLFDLGRQLFSLSKCLLQTNFGDRNQYLVIDLDQAPQFSDFGFTAL